MGKGAASTRRIQPPLGVTPEGPLNGRGQPMHDDLRAEIHLGQILTERLDLLSIGTRRNWYPVRSSKVLGKVSQVDGVDQELRARLGRDATAEEVVDELNRIRQQAHDSAIEARIASVRAALEASGGSVDALDLLAETLRVRDDSVLSKRAGRSARERLGRAPTADETAQEAARLHDEANALIRAALVEVAAGTLSGPDAVRALGALRDAAEGEQNAYEKLRAAAKAKLERTPTAEEMVKLLRRTRDARLQRIFTAALAAATASASVAPAAPAVDPAADPAAGTVTDTTAAPVAAPAEPDAKGIMTEVEGWLERNETRIRAVDRGLATLPKPAYAWTLERVTGVLTEKRLSERPAWDQPLKLSLYTPLDRVLEGAFMLEGEAMADASELTRAPLSAVDLRMANPKLPHWERQLYTPRTIVDARDALARGLRFLGPDGGYLPGDPAVTATFASGERAALYLDEVMLDPAVLAKLCFIPGARIEGDAAGAASDEAAAEAAASGDETEDGEDRGRSISGGMGLTMPHPAVRILGSNERPFDEWSLALRASEAIVGGYTHPADTICQGDCASCSLVCMRTFTKHTACGRWGREDEVEEHKRIIASLSEELPRLNWELEMLRSQKAPAAAKKAAEQQADLKALTEKVERGTRELREARAALAESVPCSAGNEGFECPCKALFGQVQREVRSAFRGQTRSAAPAPIALYGSDGQPVRLTTEPTVRGFIEVDPASGKIRPAEQV